jgi:tetratricopeptide (TPR) repeat protein
MASLWYALSDSEQTACDELSEDLYIIERKRAAVSRLPEETHEIVRQRLAAAFKAEEYQHALALIRKLDSIDSPTVYAMGRCWEREGFMRAAVCFYDFANELEPKANYEVMALEALMRAGASEEVIERANRIESRPGVPSTLRLAVAAILHQTADCASGAEQRHVYERVIHLVDAAWSDETVLPSLRARALIAAGFSFEHLGDSERALASFERAVVVHRVDSTLCARGLALLSVNRSRALQDLTDAAKLGTRLDVAYLYAALHALESRKFAEVEAFCEAGLEVSRRVEVRGRLLEWWAIAAFELDRSPDTVTELFEQAMAELPLNLVLRRNFYLYQESLKTNRSVPSGEWEVTQVELDEAAARARQAFEHERRAA